MDTEQRVKNLKKKHIMTIGLDNPFVTYCHACCSING